MDTTDNRLGAINESGDEIRFAVKTQMEEVLAWSDVPAHSGRDIVLVNKDWDDILPDIHTAISVYCVRKTWWDSVKNWNQVNHETALKVLVLTRAELDSLQWKIRYP